MAEKKFPADYGELAALVAGLKLPVVDETEGSLEDQLKWAYLTTLAKLIYPVGSIYISTISTNPGTLFGFGTWNAFGTGRTLVGIDSGQTEFDAVEETGGAKTHTLTTTEMPAHTHTRGERAWNGPSSGNSGRLSASDVGGTGVVSDTDSGSTGSAGSGGAHNNLQPYIVVYMWKRTA